MEGLLFVFCVSSLKKRQTAARVRTGFPSWQQPKKKAVVAIASQVPVRSS
jgi:hypothetical protein